MKKYESWVSSFVDRLLEYFNLVGWTIHIEHTGDAPEAGDGNLEYAKIYVDSAYSTAHLTLNKQAREDFEKKNFNRLKMGLVHELIHIFLDPFNSFISPHLSETTKPYFGTMLEQQTQKLTMVLLKSLPKSLIPKR